jgi:hypothetical protein
MGPNFLECDREQVLLLPPDLREWLPERHLAWFVIDAVDQLDLTAFYAAYRLDGQGRAARNSLHGKRQRSSVRGRSRTVGRAPALHSSCRLG